MNEKSLKVPNNLIKRCRNKQNGLTYKYLALFVKLKLESDDHIDGCSDSYVSERFNISRNIVSNGLEVLINNNLIRKNGKKLFFASEDELLSRYSDFTYINKIDFSKCRTICDYADMLKMSIIQLKISQMAYALSNSDDHSRDITNDLFIKTYIPDVDKDINMCLTHAGSARLLGEKTSSVTKMFNRHKKKGTINLKTIFYDVYIEDQSIEIRFGKKIYKNNNTKKTRVNYGSFIEIKNITTEVVKEEIVRYVKAC